MTERRHYRAVGQVFIMIPFDRLVEGESEDDVRQYIVNHYERRHADIHKIEFESIKLQTEKDD